MVDFAMNENRTIASAVASAIVAFAMANGNDASLENLEREAERLFRIVGDRMEESDREHRFSDVLADMGHLLRTVRTVKIEGSFDSYDTYAG